jgi:glyceraldehyde-3-phosphate dehydrogenase/erythrose-4-phosphate dehydrogenase
LPRENRGATEEMVAGVIKGAKAAGTVIEEVGKGKFDGNTIRVYVHEGMKVAVDETRNLIMSMRSIDPKEFKLDR